MDFEDLFLQHLPHIDRVAAAVCRRSSFSPEDAEDFAQWVKLRILEDDHAVLRKFRGDCSLEVYLANVVNFRFHDYRDHLWGKYRPSEKAKALGSEAVSLELRLVRDGLTLNEAIEDLLTRDATASREELEELAGQLPIRVQRRRADDSLVSELGVDGEIERTIEEGERRALSDRVWKILENALRDLPREDRILMRLTYEEGVRVSDLAGPWKTTRRSLYTRRDRCLRHLRRAFKNADLAWDEVRELIGWEHFEAPGPRIFEVLSVRTSRKPPS